MTTCFGLYLLGHHQVKLLFSYYVWPDDGLISKDRNMLSFTWLPPYNKIVVICLTLSYINCDTYDCTHNGDEPPKDYGTDRFCGLYFRFYVSFHFFLSFHFFPPLHAVSNTGYISFISYHREVTDCVAQCCSTAGPWHQLYRAARDLRKLQYDTRLH